MSLHVAVTGSGPDLVLLHGWALNLGVWESLIEQLRGRFRLIAMDLPGHGRNAGQPFGATPAEQDWLIHQTLATVSNRYSVLGWSLGAQIALDLAAALPAQVERLVLVAGTAKFVASADWTRGIRGATVERLDASLRSDHKRAVREFLKLQVRGSARGPLVLQKLQSALRVHGEAEPPALAAGLKRLAESDLRPLLPHVHAPALVIAGQHDRITLPAASRALAQGLPDARYVEIRRAAHAPFLSHQSEFVAVVARFLRSASAVSTRTRRARARRSAS